MLLHIIDGQGPGRVDDGSGLRVHLRNSSSNATTAVFVDSSDQTVFEAQLAKDEELVKNGYKIIFRGFTIEKGIIAQPLNIHTGKPIGGIIHPTIATLEIYKI